VTIYGLQYRPAPYAATSRGARLLPLIRLEFTSLFRTRWGAVGYLLCMVPTFVRLVMLLVWLDLLSFSGPPREMRHAPQVREFLPDNVTFYVDGIVDPAWGLLVFLMLTSLVTARAIAKDRATNALEFYWTRGVSPLGYFAGKWIGTLLLVATMTVLAPVVLWLLAVLLSDDWGLLAQTWSFMPGAVAGLCAFTAILVTLGTLVSAAAGNPNLASILWCMLLFGSWAVGQAGAGLMHKDSVVGLLSLFDAAGVIAHALAGIPQRGASVVGSAVLLLIVGGVLAALARRRLRLQEAIG